MAFIPGQAAKGCRNKNSVPFSRLREGDALGAAFEESQREMGPGEIDAGQAASQSCPAVGQRG